GRHAKSTERHTVREVRLAHLRVHLQIDRVVVTDGRLELHPHAELLERDAGLQRFGNDDGNLAAGKELRFLPAPGDEVRLREDLAEAFALDRLEEDGDVALRIQYAER